MLILFVDVTQEWDVGRDTFDVPDEEAIILWEIGRGGNGVVRLGGGVHLRKNLLGKSLDAGEEM